MIARLTSDYKSVTAVDHLRLKKYCVYIEWVRVLAGDRMADDVESVLESLRSINVNVSDELKAVRLAEEGHLQIPVAVLRFEAVIE